jgi:hypothetical protein
MIWLNLIIIADTLLIKLGVLSAVSLKVVIGQERLGCDWERYLGREPE